MLKIPTFARIAWNTFDQKDLWRDDQESIFLATFDDFPSKTLHKHQIDYSYYNRGRFEAAPKFILHVYSFGQDFENYSDTINYFDKEYDTMDEAAGDINHWLQVFQDKVTDMQAQKTKNALAKQREKPSISTLSLNLIFRKGTPQYILDFFKKGVKIAQLPSVLYDYKFNFKNKPNFSSNTTMFCEKKKGRYYLHIYHKFDFETQAAEGYWFVGGLAQYAENDDMAGYIKHAETGTQLFGFRDQLPYWLNDVKIEFDETKYKKMSIFQNIKKGFPSTIAIPEGMEKFCDWYAANEALPGGDFELFADDGEAITDWSRIPDLHPYFVQFGSTGNGSMIGIWQDETGKQTYMHLSSDEGWGTELADNFVDFLRILAIGYETLGYFTAHTVQELNKLAENEDLNQGFNPQFKAWVETEFKTTVPTTNVSFKREGTPFNDWLKTKSEAHEKAAKTPQNLYDILDKIRERPALYTGEHSLSAIYHFINGFYMAHNQETSETPSFDGFNDFVGKFYGKYTTAGWKNLILADHFGNEHEALTRFYVLLDEFRAVSQKPNSRAIVIKLLDKGIADLAEIKAHKTDLKDILHLISSQLNTAIYGGISVWYDTILDDIFLKAKDNNFLHNWLKTTVPKLVFYEYELWSGSDGKNTDITLIPSNHTRKELVLKNSDVLIKTFFALNEEKAQDVKEIFMAEGPLSILTKKLNKKNERT